MIISQAHNLDCMSFMPQFPNKFFDWVIADVPYGLDVGNMAYLQETKRKIKQKNGTELAINKTVHQFADWDKRPPPQSYFDEVCRVSQNQIIFGVEYVDWQSLGKGRIKWNKGFAKGVSFKSYEIAYASFTNEIIEINLLWAGMMQAESLERPMRQQGNKKLNEKRIHPTQKPVLLYKKLLQDFCKQGDKILDTHLGSQSSRIACFDLGFDFWGCELNTDYFNKANQRFNEHIHQPKQANLFSEAS